MALGADLWLKVDGHALGERGRIGLLRAVAEHGSITAGAKAYGLSYKAAWDALDEMNRIARQPLLERSAGGRGGGATRLTAYGQRLLERHAQVQAVHRRFLALLEHGALDLDREFSLLEVMNVKTSARNQWRGVVEAVRTGAVNDEVLLALPGGARLSAVVTHTSTAALGLVPGMPVAALVKSSSVLLATGLKGARVSARNQLTATVVSVQPGAVNAEVELRTDGGETVVAVVPQDAVAALGLVPGAAATALIKASDVILATVA